MKTVKLIPGKMNALLTIVPAGYAEGAKPKAYKKGPAFQTRTVLRKREFKTEAA